MEINIMQVLFQAINFGVILFLLNKFLYQPIQKLLDDRQAKINDGLKAAEKNLTAEADLAETRKKELAKAKREASKIVKEAKEDAKKQAQAILKQARSQAKQEAENIIETAKSNLQAQEKKMAAALKDLTIATTRKLLRESLSDKDVKAITNNMLKKLK